MVRTSHNTGRKRVVKRPLRKRSGNPKRYLISPLWKEGTIVVAVPSHRVLSRITRSVEGLEWVGPASLGSKIKYYRMVDTPENREKAQKAGARVKLTGYTRRHEEENLDRSNPVTDWVLGPYGEFSSAMEKAQRLQSQGHHVRYTEPEYGKHTGLDREWWIHGYSLGEIPEGARLGDVVGTRNPNYTRFSPDEGKLLKYIVTTDDEIVFSSEDRNAASMAYEQRLLEGAEAVLWKQASRPGPSHLKSKLYEEVAAYEEEPVEEEENPNRLSVKMGGMRAVFESEDAPIAVAEEGEAPVTSATQYDGEGFAFELVPLKELNPPVKPGQVENQEYAEDIARSMRTSGWTGRPLLGVVKSESPSGERRIQLLTGSHRYFALLRLWESGEWPKNLPTVMVPVHLMRKDDVPTKTWSDWTHADWYKLKRLAEAGKGPEEVVRLMRAERNPQENPSWFALADDPEVQDFYLKAYAAHKAEYPYSGHGTKIQWDSRAQEAARRKTKKWLESRGVSVEENPSLLRKIDAYLFPPSISLEPMKGAKQYKGIWVYPSALGFSTSIEPESYFDTRKDAEKFVEAWIARKGNPALDPDKHYVLVFKTKTGSTTQTLAYKGSDQKGIEKALKHIEEKYEVPKSEVLFEERKSNPHYQERDYANYFTMPAYTEQDEDHVRFVEALLRKWGYATTAKYSEGKPGPAGGRVPQKYVVYTDAGRKSFMKAVQSFGRKENPIEGAHGPHSEITMYSPNEGDTTAYGRDIYTGAWHVLYGGRSVKEIEDFIERNKFQRPGHKNEWAVNWLESEHGEGVYSPVQIYERQGGVNRVVKTWPNGTGKVGNPRSPLERELRQILVWGTYRLYGLHATGWGQEEVADYTTAPARFARIIEQRQQRDVRMHEPVTQFMIMSIQSGSNQDRETVWQSRPEGKDNPRSHKHLSYRAYLQSPEAQQVLQIRAPGMHEAIEEDYRTMVESARARRGTRRLLRHERQGSGMSQGNPVVLGPRIEEQAHEAGREVGQQFVVRPKRLTEYLVLESYKDWARRMGLMDGSMQFSRPLYSRFRVGALEAVGAGASRNPRHRRRTR